MYHVLIVDDHLDQRELLKFLFKKRADDWQFHEAINGKEALTMIDKQPIDLLITDIQMPFVTGIELAEVLRARQNKLPILFISGYDDFNYAKKALDLQAVNYLLKPINPDEFYQQLDKLVVIIEQEKATKRQGKRVIQQDTLINLFKGVPLTKLSEQQQAIAIPIIENTWFLMALDVNSYQAAKLENYLAYHTSEKITFIRTSLTRFVGLFHTHSLNEAMVQRRQLQQTLQQELGIEVTSEISAPVQNATQIYQSYQQLEQKISKDFYHKERDLTAIAQLPTYSLENETNFFRSIDTTIQQHSFEQFGQQIKDLLTLYEQTAYESPSIVRFFFANLYRTIVKSVELDAPEVQQGLEAILEATDFSQIAQAFEPLLEMVAARISTLTNTTNDYIRKTKNYMWNHYAEDINLELLASNVHLAPKYLSDLFKREEAIGITKYLTEIRMEKAKDLLINSHYRVREISQLVGFNSHSYFIKSFQKYTGSTPERYRKAKGRIEDET